MVDKDFSLQGDVALVTGSGRGLGHAIAARLAELGADVAIHDRDDICCAEFGEFANLEASAADIAQHGTKAIAVTGDIADASRVFDMAREVESKLGPITILVNAAGGDIAARGGKPNPNDALHIKLEDIRAIVDRNLIGTMLMSQAVVRGMVERRRGCVVNIASAAGHFGTSPEVAYSSIKAAIVHYTRCLAFETRPHYVRVNCVSPGATATGRFLVTRTIDPALLVEDGTFQRYGSPRDQANAVAFLCSPAAKFIHGQVLRVDGGLTLYAS
jgi:NAD(P)-dependent dehydrogenase (short-subunit alcohol dehydrogenase family)